MATGAGEFGSIVMAIDDQKIDTWVEYAFQSHWLTPTDAWHFRLGDEVVTPTLMSRLQAGAKVKLTINDKVQGYGYIDGLNVNVSRQGGTDITINGRDTLSPVVDSQLAPHTLYNDTTLLALLQTTLKDFGFTKFDVSAEEHINRVTGRAFKRKKAKKQLGQFQVPKGKAHQNEGVFAFLSRVTQRYGLWPSLSSDGETIVVSKPDFDQQPRYKLIHKIGGAQNNVEQSSLRVDSTDQPSFIHCTGNIPATERDVVTNYVVIQGPFAFKDRLPNGAKTFPEFLNFVPKGTQTITTPAPPVQFTNMFASKVARGIYLRDDESHTIEQLQNYALRQLSLHTRKAVCAEYTIMGHELNGQPVTPDTMVDVDDDRMNIHTPLWILSVTHRKSRQGTFSDLECIPPNTLNF